jgi:hypothetical protein
MLVATITLERIELWLICRCKLLDKDPNKKIKVGIVEVLQEVDLDAPPTVIWLNTIQHGEGRHILGFTDHCCLEPRDKITCALSP